MENIFCQYCGTPNNEDASFCRKCGKQLNSIPQTPEQPVSPSVAQQTIPPQVMPSSFNPQPVQVFPQEQKIPLQPAAIPVPPKKKKGKILLIGILLAVVGCCLAIGGYYQLFLKPIQKTGDYFLTALQNQDYASAFEMMSSDVQTQLGSAEGLQNFIEANEFTFTSYKTGTLKRITGDPPQGLLLADLVHADGTKTAVEVDMEVDPNNIWRVFGFGKPTQ